MDRDISHITTEEYRERRRRVLESLDGAAAVVFAGTATASDYPMGRWKTDRYFWYLTGLDYESGAAVAFDPSAEDPQRRITLFMRSRDPEVERWDGARSPLDSALKAKTGFTSLARTGALPGKLTDAARRTKRLACLHPFTSYAADLSPDLAVFKKICDHVPGVALEDRTALLAGMRAVKSPAELALMERAGAITAAAFAAALRSIRPGVTEKAVAETLSSVFREHEAEPAFEPIVGSGPNGAVLHYVDLDRTVQPGDLVVIDYGASYAGYAADVTRTFPANGIFTPEQRELYEVVLRANAAAMTAARPGATMTEVQQAANEVIGDAGYRDMFIHGIGHHLGIECHDCTPDGPLGPGMVVTIEPGIYFPDRGVGIRIEDDVLITETGNVNLTAAIPRTVDEVEAAMGTR
jgi:Xaa-Pro aminopeptidase